MFTWHEATRRRLCRLAFLALVVVPTCAMLLAAAWIRSPLAVAGHRRALAEQLALDVKLDQVSFPRPAVTRYEGLAIFDPESGDCLASLGRLEIDNSGQKTLVTCTQTELNAAALELFWELAARRLRRQSSLERPMEIVCRELTLHFGDHAETLLDVHTRFKQGDAGPQGLVVFHLAEQDPTAEVRMALVRNRQPSGIATIVQLETAAAVLPGRLMAALLPGWHQLGLSAALTGSLWWQDGPEGWSGQIRGRISGVDLDALVSDRFGRKFGGSATIDLERARIQQGRLVDAKGSVSAGPGLMSRALLADAAIHLHAPAGALSESPGALVTYDQLRFLFTLDEAGLALQGACLTDQPGTLVLGRAGRPLLMEPPAEPQSVLNLVRALAGAPEERLPVSSAAQDLIRLLPASKLADETLEARRPHR
jgi:hypothetical protein